MESLTATELLAALGHETRLGIFRLLVEAGPEGVIASSLGEQMALAPATLSFHLAHLTRVGLITGTRESRFIRYAADFGVMDELLAFLTNNCCQGKACLPKTAALQVVKAGKSAKTPHAPTAPHTTVTRPQRTQSKRAAPGPAPTRSHLISGKPLKPR